MNISGVICEFNPLHNGHLYLLNKIRENGATHIIAVMSGNFTQRGEPAVMSKWARTETALKCGADLVIELPVAYSVASAEKFAFGGVYILNSLNCVDKLYFGTESDDLNALKNMAELFNNSETVEEIKLMMRKGTTYAKATEATAVKHFGESYAHIIKSPNNILALEYLKSLMKLKSGILPQNEKRVAVEHDSSKYSGNFASASFVRGLICQGFDFKNYVPKETAEVFEREYKNYRCPVTIKSIERETLLKLRSYDTVKLKNLPDVSEGLEYKIKAAADAGTSYDETVSGIKSKRYTHARLRRILLCALLDITKEIQNTVPQYIRVLGFNQRGVEIMSQIKKSCPYPLITLPSKQKKLLSAKQNELLMKDIISGNMYNAMMPRIQKSFDDYTLGCIKLI